MKLEASCQSPVGFLELPEELQTHITEYLVSRSPKMEQLWEKRVQYVTFAQVNLAFYKEYQPRIRQLEKEIADTIHFINKEKIRELIINNANLPLLKILFHHYPLKLLECNDAWARSSLHDAVAPPYPHLPSPSFVQFILSTIKQNKEAQPLLSTLVDQQDIYCQTPLYRISRLANRCEEDDEFARIFDIMKNLLENGADPNSVCNASFDPDHPFYDSDDFCERNSRSPFYEILIAPSYIDTKIPHAKRVELIKLFLLHKASLGKKPKNGYSPLQLLIFRGAQKCHLQAQNVLKALVTHFQKEPQILQQQINMLESNDEQNEFCTRFNSILDGNNSQEVQPLRVMLAPYLPQKKSGWQLLFEKLQACLPWF